MTTVPIDAQQTEPRIVDAAVVQPSGADPAPLTPFEWNARLVTRVHHAAPALRHGHAPRDTAGAFDHEDVSACERRGSQAPPERPPGGQRDLEDPHPAYHARRGLLAAAAPAGGDGEEKDHDDRRAAPQPVHPMRRMPPYAD